MADRNTPEDQPDRMSETSEERGETVEDTNNFGEPQIAAYLKSFEKAIEHLEAGEVEYRAEVEALRKQIHDHNVELNRRAETLHSTQQKLAKRAVDLNQNAKDLITELNAYNDVMRAGESTLSKLLDDFEIAKQRQIKQG